MPAWIYYRADKELRFSAKYFSQKKEAVAKVSWLNGVKRGISIKPGKEMAKLTWGQGKITTLKAPSGCSGKIESVNRRIKTANLDKRPSQWALYL